LTTQLLTKKQVAQFFQVCPKTIERWCHNGVLPFEVWPCGKRFDPAKIDQVRKAREFNHQETK